MPWSLCLASCVLCLIIPQQSHAISALCEKILTLQPVSTHYTKRVIERAERGIQHAKNAKAPADLLFELIPWSKSIAGAQKSLIEAQLQLSNQADSMQETACQRFDEVYIECEMDKVGDELRTALDRGSMVAITRLEGILQFLNESREHLDAGALDPAYVDTTWGERKIFDPPGNVWCCEGSMPGNACRQMADAACINGNGTAFEGLDRCLGMGCTAPADVPPEETSLCPFSSDYADPYMNGFGCDATVMQPRTGTSPSFDEEFAALTKLTGGIPGYAAREHRTANGCSTKPGYCALNPALRCTLNSECNGLALGDCIYLDGSCSLNEMIRCDNDGPCTETDAGVCIPGRSADDIPRMTMRGALSADKDRLGIMRRFQKEHLARALNREFTDDLKLPAEFPPEKAALRTERENASELETGFRDTARQTVEAWNRLQGKEEARIVTTAIDTPLSLTADLSALRREVRRLSLIASTKDGMRQLVIGMAYLLRRSCIYRPCNERLEQIMKIAFSDACFPYASGEFTTDTVEQPRWRKCAREACILIPGMTAGEYPPECAGLF